MPAATATTQTPPATDLDLIRAYLTLHDAPCPTCHYNLRGAIHEHQCSPICPECGTPLQLTLHPAAADSTIRRMAFLVIAWPLLFCAYSAFSTLSYWIVYGWIDTSWHPLLDLIGDLLIVIGAAALLVVLYRNPRASWLAGPATVPLRIGWFIFIATTVWMGLGIILWLI